ncbi:MAG: DMT family transporter [Chloroflexi bacterium]|nr:DMT family transporter [Chloroflexota bacterium]
MRLRLAAPSIAQIWVLVAVSAVAWSFGPICVRYAFQYDIPPALLSFGRMITGVVMFAPYIWYKGQREIAAMPGRTLWLAIGAGTLSGTNILLMIASLEHISVMVNQAFIATIPIWVAVFEVILLRENLGKAIWIGILAAFAGGFMIAFATSGEPAIIEGRDPTLGVLLAITSACSAGLYIIVGRRLRGSVSFVPYIWLVYAGGAFVTLFVIAISGVSLVGYDPRGYLWMLLLAILAQIIGHGALNYVVKFMSPTTLTMSVQTVPVMSAVWAYFIFNEIPTAWQAIGGAILLLGVMIVLKVQNPPQPVTD